MCARLPRALCAGSLRALPGRFGTIAQVVPWLQPRVVQLGTGSAHGLRAPFLAQAVEEASDPAQRGVVVGFHKDGRALVRLSDGARQEDVLASGKLLMRGLHVQLQRASSPDATWEAAPLQGMRQRRPKGRCIHPTRAGSLCRDCPRRKGRSQ
mmetsp:Transcript_12766/g.35023  ORF Transcript_12766/g.35023 Transcript_12766/m.35023 type:complete len:153 (-) Transcript_12766:79-537(-)